MSKPTNSKILLFLGGSKSGKSIFAEKCAHKWEKVVYYATGGQIDNSSEWETRIQKHRERRPSHWITVEYPTGIEAVVHLCQEQKVDVLLIDCLTLWMGWQIASNIQIYSQIQLLKHLETETQHFIKQVQNLNCPVLVVSNEVGEGVVPGTESGRVFREALGSMNIAFGEAALCICFSMAGKHLLLKSPSQDQRMQNGFCPLGIVNEDFLFSEINHLPQVGETHDNK